jgi:hypothetical protein
MEKVNSPSTDFESHTGQNNDLPIIYGRGIGERDSQLQKIVDQLSEHTGRRVYTTQSNEKEPTINRSWELKKRSRSLSILNSKD